MDLKLIAGIFYGKIISKIINLKGGGGTAAPGYYALKLEKDLVKKLSRKNNLETILIAGTNGKTTTSRILAEAARASYKILHNRQGSNLSRGIASTLIKHASVFGKIKNNLAIWEVDEAVLPEAIRETSPKIIILLNLFRDQLDRYGEVENVRKRWESAISKLSAQTTLIVNADDPQVSFVTKVFKGKVIYFGVEDKNLELPQMENVGDSKFCLNCTAKLFYSSVFSSHLGHWSCPNCDMKREKPQISAKNIKFNVDLSTKIDLSVNSTQFSVNYPLPGLFNVYNVMAAFACASALKIDTNEMASNIKDFEAAFGRFQKITFEGKKAVIFLIKNPAGANEVIRTVSTLKNIDLLSILNDKLADGRDVSWIWDVNWEMLMGKTDNTTVSGIRSWDMALRLKYAGLNKVNVHEEISYSLKSAFEKMNSKNTLMILPTYTAMLELQKALKKKGVEKWQEQ